MVSVVIPNFHELMLMIEKNIFQPSFSEVKKNNLEFSETGIERAEYEIEAAWPHILGIYEILLTLLISESVEYRSLKVYMTPYFVERLLELFDSGEPVQRNFLKIILHKLYIRAIGRRKMIRKAISNCFYTLIHENHKFNGASELLDITASIVSGFAVPLRKEHVIYFKNVIIPLHKVQTCGQFHV